MLSEEAIFVEAAEDVICIRELQIEGKRKMKAGEFLRGREFTRKTILG